MDKSQEGGNMKRKNRDLSSPVAGVLRNFHKDERPNLKVCMLFRNGYGN